VSFQLINTGIIDWEFAAILPEYSVESYPLFLLPPYRLAFFNRLIPFAQQEMTNWQEHWTLQFPKKMRVLLDRESVLTRYALEQSIKDISQRELDHLELFITSDDVLKFPRVFRQPLVQATKAKDKEHSIAKRELVQATSSGIPVSACDIEIDNTVETPENSVPSMSKKSGSLKVSFKNRKVPSEPDNAQPKVRTATKITKSGISATTTSNKRSFTAPKAWR
jgi:hypothetical protein